MIRINLLPHREAAKKARKDQFIASAFLSVLAGGLIAGGIYLYFQALISDQNSANALITAENERLKGQIKEVENIEREIAALKSRQEAVENLQSERNLPVQVLNTLLRTVPNGSYVQSLKQTGSRVGLVGEAQSNETVSALLRNLTDQTPWDTRPQLVETKATMLKLDSKNQRRVFGYSLNYQLTKPAAAEADEFQQ